MSTTNTAFGHDQLKTRNMRLEKELAHEREEREKATNLLLDFRIALREKGPVGAFQDHVSQAILSVPNLGAFLKDASNARDWREKQLRQQGLLRLSKAEATALDLLDQWTIVQRDEPKPIPQSDEDSNA